MNLAQFYTDSTISTQFVSEFLAPNPETVIDIGCGELGLLKAARKRWGGAKLIGYDIDPKHTSGISDEKILLNLGDGLDPDLSQRIEEIHGRIDLAVSNPPYITVDRTLKTQNILRRACLLEGVSQTQTLFPAELIFLAQNLLVMKDQSELGIILPSSFISGERWKPLRELLISQYTITCCLEIPSKSFSKTEVSTYALFIKKEKSTSSSKNQVMLKSIYSTNSISINVTDAIHRLDYSYYYNLSSPLHQKLHHHDVIEIFRGNKTHACLNENNVTHFHTTDLKNDTQILYGHSSNIPKGVRFASQGDILISRVGTRCLGKAGYLASGRIAVSDCILVVRALSSSHLWETISNENFKDYILKIALGSGAKYITKSILGEVFNAR